MCSHRMLNIYFFINYHKVSSVIPVEATVKGINDINESLSSNKKNHG